MDDHKLTGDELRVLHRVVISTWTNDDLPTIERLVPVYVSHDPKRTVFGVRCPYMPTSTGVAVWKKERPWGST